MRSWPKHPVIYEINTRVWLGDLSRKYGRPVNLSTVSVSRALTNRLAGLLVENPG